jgi:hypothetical protein
LSQTLSEFAKVQRFSIVAPAAKLSQGANATMTLRTAKEMDNLEIILEFEGVELVDVEPASVYLEEEFWLGDVSGRKWEDWVDVHERDWRALKWAVSSQGEWGFFSRTARVADLRRVSKPAVLPGRELVAEYKDAFRNIASIKELGGRTPDDSRSKGFAAAGAGDDLREFLRQFVRIREFELAAVEGSVEDVMSAAVTLSDADDRSVSLEFDIVDNVRFNPRHWFVGAGFQLEDIAGRGTSDSLWLLTGGDELTLKAEAARIV